MQIIEEVANFEIDLSKDVYCNGVSSQADDWSARIDGYGATPTAEQLLKNMKAAKTSHPNEVVVPKKVKEKAGSDPFRGWDFAKCTKHCFPFQTHHLIPKKHLPGHPVCVWLTKEYKKNSYFELNADTNYDTDHYMNGYCLPFASSTHQWKKADEDPIKEGEICDKMMELTGLQLHQGEHTYKEHGNEDEGHEDEENVEQGSYLGRVDQLLRVVRSCTRTHVASCDTCNKGKVGKKVMVQPVARVVGHMYRVSQLLKKFIDRNKIFVSKRAFLYFNQKHP